MIDPPIPVWIHPSRSLQAVASQRATALSIRVIPPAFLYESQRQSELWLEVANAYQPDLKAFYRKIFGRLPFLGAEDPFRLISLGCGAGQKEQMLVKAWKPTPTFRFCPVDVSSSLAMMSAESFRGHMASEPRPLVTDLLETPELAEWLDADREEERRLFTAFGLTPNFLPRQLLPELRNFLRDERDELLISANLMPNGTLDDVRHEYDNAPTRAWLWQLLVDWGLTPFVDELIFREESTDTHHRILVEVPWNGEVDGEQTAKPITTDQPLLLFQTLRFTLDTFLQELTQHGFTVEDAWESDCQREGLARVTRNDF